MSRVSIIIPVYNKASLTRQCLNNLLSQSKESTLRGECEIIVADDASSDLTPRLLAGYGDRIRVVTHASNTGYAMACNDAAAIGDGEFLVFLNNDTIPQAGWLEALVEYATQHPRAAVVGSKLLYPDGTIQHAGIVICQDLLPRHIYAGFPGDHPAVDKSRRYPAVTGACILVRHSAFESAGGFDSAFANSYEDVDLCLRMGEEGLEAHYCHTSVLYHLESATRGLDLPQEAQNKRLYLSRWGHRVEPDDLRYFIEDGLIQIHYRPLYPLELEISPLLGLAVGGESEQEAEQILNARCRQVLELLRDNIRLTVQLREATFCK